KVLRGRDSVLGDRFDRLRPVGKARSVAKIKVVGCGHLADKLLEHRQPADTGIEYADLHCIALTTASTSLVLYVAIRSAWPASVSRSLPSIMIFTCVICGTLAETVSMIDASVSDSTSTPERWVLAKSEFISITAR